MIRLGAVLAVALLFALAVIPAPAHAFGKEAGGVALVVAGGFLVAGGVFLYAVRYNAEELDSPATAYLVAGAGVASIITGAIVLKSGESEKKQSSLQLTPLRQGIALAYHF
jgi:hypothetical protein